VKNTYLEFEQPIAELEEQIEKLRYMQGGSALDISEEIAKLEKSYSIWCVISTRTLAAGKSRK